MPTHRDLRLALRISAAAKAVGTMHRIERIAEAIAIQQSSAVSSMLETSESGQFHARNAVKSIDLNCVIAPEESAMLRFLPAPMRRKSISSVPTIEADHFSWNDERWRSFLLQPSLALEIAWTRSQISFWDIFRQEGLLGKRPTFGMLFPRYRLSGCAFSKVSEVNLLLEKSGSNYRLKWSKCDNLRLRWHEVCLTLEAIQPTL